MCERARIAVSVMTSVAVLTLAGAGGLPGRSAARGQDARDVAGQSPPLVDFVTQIKPIFESRCVECHGGASKKGGLRLDRRVDVFPGDDPEEWTVVPGEPEKSELFTRISLPADDFDIMPAEGDPLTTEQIALIRRWIEEGAVWPASADAVDPEDTRIILRELTEEEQAAIARSVVRLEARGAIVLPIANDTSAISVNFSLLGADVSDDDLRLLRDLEPVLCWLNLARTNVTDEGVHLLRHFAELRRLHLQSTAITDRAARSLAGLEHLHYLNLYGTRVGDEGLKSLESMKSLRRLYLWQTPVTMDGVARLRLALPELEVDTGDYALVAPPPAEEPANPAALPADATCCEKALATGATCDHPCCVEAAAKGEVCLKCNPSGVIRGKQ